MSGFHSERIDKRELSLALKRATAGDIRAFAAELDRLEVPDDRSLDLDGAVLRLDVWDKA